MEKIVTQDRIVYQDVIKEVPKDIVRCVCARRDGSRVGVGVRGGVVVRVGISVGVGVGVRVGVWVGVSGCE